MLLCDKAEIVIYLNNFQHHVCIIVCHVVPEVSSTFFKLVYSILSAIWSSKKGRILAPIIVQSR